GAHILAHGAGKADEVDTVMLVETPVLGGEHGFHHMVGQLVDRDGIALDDAALADLAAVTVEEGDGQLALAAPVAGGFLEGGQSEREKADRGDRAPGEGLAGQLDEGAAPAARPE